MSKLSSGLIHLVLAIICCLAGLAGLYGALSTHRQLNARKDLVQALANSFRTGETNGKISSDLAALLVKDSQIQIEFLDGIQGVNGGLIIGSGINILASLAFFSLSLQTRVHKTDAGV